MPSLDVYKRVISSKGNTVGTAHKTHSDIVMEATWGSDIQSKVCYIYDYFHDDKPWLAEDITYENTTKTKIDAKFIVTKYSSIDKDQVEYHIMFRPSQPVRFNNGDDLYYFETDYKDIYLMTFPIGFYIDIPDEKNCYRKWLIVEQEEGNQFIKYSVLPCDYRLQWIEHNKNTRIKRQMWCATRAMNSYTSGLWIDRYFNSLDDVNKVWLPLNPITEKLGFLGEDGQNQRIILSALTRHPLTWKISKIENTKPIGIYKITLDQDSFNPNTDYVNYETKEMYADYYSSSLTPKEDTTVLYAQNHCEITTSTNTIKCGGSYKLLTLNIFDSQQNNITDLYTDSLDIFSWEFFIDGKNITNDGIILLKQLEEKNKIRIKFTDNREYLTKILTVKCNINKNTETLIGEIPLEIIPI